MSDAHSTDSHPKSVPAVAAAEASNAPRIQKQSSRLIVDIGPTVLFMIAYNVANRTRPDEAIFISTGVYMVAAVAALIYARVKERRWPLMLLVTAVIVVLFGGATLIFHNATFAYIKPTIINSLFAVGIFGSLLVGQNVWKLLFGSVFELPDRIWRILAIRWGCWFVFLAILNELIWRNFSEAFWANFKVFGVLPMTFLFALANTPIVLKNAIEEKPAEPEGEPGT